MKGEITPDSEALKLQKVSAQLRHHENLHKEELRTISDELTVLGMETHDEIRRKLYEKVKWSVRAYIEICI